MVLILIGVGVMAKKSKVLSDEADACVLKLLINVLLPAFIFAEIIGNEKLKSPQNIFYAPLAGFLGVAVPVIICLFLSRYVFKKFIPDAKAQRTFALAAGLQNYGYIALPVIAEVFGKELTGLMLLHNTGVELALWSVGLIVLSGEINSNSWKKVVNAPFIAVLISIVLNSTGWDFIIPKPVSEAYNVLGQTFIPVGLLLVGATCFSLVHKSDFFKKILNEGKWNVILGNLLRSGLLPLIILGMASILPYSDDLCKVIIIEAAMPAAFMPILLARHFDGRPEVALHVSMSSMVIGIALIPFWVTFGKSMLGV